MFLLFVAEALASTCSVTLATREAYRPVSGDLALPGEPGGWRKGAMSTLTPARRAQIEIYKKAFKRYPASIQDELLRGDLPDGLDEVAAVVAWGEPGYLWTTGRRCVGLLYGVDEGRPVALNACEGRIVERLDLARTVPCARLTEGAARCDRERKAMGGYTFAQQVEIVAGHRADWMDGQAMELAFGRDPEPDAGEPAVLLADVPLLPRPPSPIPLPVPPDTARGPESPPVPAPVAPAARVASPEPTTSAVPRSARIDALPSLPIRGADLRFTLTCGGDYELELALGEPFRATATSRKASGSVIKRSTQGSAQGFEDRVQLLGLGVYTYATRTLTLGPWPDPGCLGVEVEAAPAE